MASRLNLSSLLLMCLVLLSLVGAWHFGIAGKFYAKAWLADQLIERAWQQTLNGESNIRPWPWADTWPVAELELPRLGVRQLILSGDSRRVLAFGPGLNEGSAVPGQSGLSVVSGHRDTNFSFLQAIETGDSIIINRSDKQYKYIDEHRR